MTSDLERAFKALKGKKTLYDAYFNYYDGDQPLVYTAKRLNEIFKDLDTYFAENWCAVVVDSARDRVNLRKIQVPKKAQKNMDAMWLRSELALESDDVHEAAMVAGEGFFVAWEGEDEKKAEGYFNDPRLIHVFYDAEHPRKKVYAAKWWKTTKGTVRMTLWYPDHLEYYETEKEQEKIQDAGAFKGRETPEAENPHEEVPVFHFRQRSRKVVSDLKNVVPIQNAINKLLTDMMVTAEYQAFPQRYIISQVETDGKLKNAPNEIFDLPAGDGVGQQTQVGQFAAAELKNYLEGIDNLATAISSITRTPKHYFFSIGSNLSGEALIAMEAPLNKKAQDRIDRFTPVWQDAMRFMFKVEGVTLDSLEIRPVFDRPETIQPHTMAEARRANVQAGVPLVSVLREEGKSEEFIAEVLEEQKKEDERKAAGMGEVYLKAMREFNGQND